MGFLWHWVTEAGSVRQDNQDFAGVALRNNLLFAMIADGVSSHPNSGGLAQSLIQSLVDTIIENAEPPTSKQLIESIKELYGRLKQPHSPPASTAFLVACFSADRLMYAVHAGDCRIGVQAETGAIIWKTDVHCLANAITPLSEERLRSHPLRNQLTRSFGTKRYKQPDMTTLDSEYVGGAVLATDGFWAELPVADQHRACGKDWNGPQKNEDDVSRLVIRWDVASQPLTVDAPRLYVRRG